MSVFDVVILNGRIVDGSGNPWYVADIAVARGRIVAIDKIGRVAARRVIDADGAVVSPGFIDIHSHADMTIETYPEAPSLIMQGVTTAVIGNCGLGLAPVSPDTEALLRSYLSPFAPALPTPLPWRRFSEYLEHLERVRPSINLAPLVAHGTVRISVMGFDRRHPTDGELRAMRDAVREAMEDGAFGLSTGLVYVPGVYSETEELVQLAEELRAFNGLYASHIRGEGDAVERAVGEALMIGRRAGVRVHVSHHKAMGRRNWGKVNATLAMMEDDRRKGFEVSCDVYPYTASSTTITSLLPAWALEGGIPAMLQRLRSPERRTAILHEMMSRRSTDQWEALRVASCNSMPEYTGKKITSLADAWGVSPAEALVRIIESTHGACTIVNFAISETDMYTVLKHPLSIVASDGLAISPEATEYVHPRSYGTFPRALRFAREGADFRLEEAVRKMTAFPAQVVRLRDRGRISVGMCADIVIFDDGMIRDRATYDYPHQFPEGILYVLVNGEVTVENGRHTGARAGQVLRARS